MALSKEQELAVKAALGGHNIFITGLAGTGKTHVTIRIISKLQSKGIPLAITSTSGISSVAIGGVTIHSFAGIGCSSAPDNILFERAVRNERACERWKQVSVLILDEVSMLSSRLFELFHRIACCFRGNDLPFGGIQLIFVGDFCQLPPPRSSFGDTFYCFESPLWSVCFPLTHCFFLQVIFRQDDPEFIAVLNELRYGKLSQKAKEFLFKLNRAILPNPTDNIIPSNLPVLNAHRIDCHIINRDRLHEGLSGPADGIHIIKSSDSGSISSKILDQVLQVPHRLALKVGCPVMVLRNIDDNIRNGTTGIVDSFLNNEFPVVCFPDSGKVFTMNKRYKWAILKDKKYGCRLQLPLMLAYSYTVHKSQGQSLEGGVLNAKGFWEAGMGYSAVTRFKSAKHLRITNFSGELNFADEKVVRFYDVLGSACANDFDFTSTPTEQRCCNQSTSETCESETVEGNDNTDDHPKNQVAQTDTHDHLFEFFNSDVHGPFQIEITLSAFQMLCKLGNFNLTEDKSKYVSDSCNLIREIYKWPNAFQMFERFFKYLWKKISDICISHSAGYLDPATQVIDKDANLAINIQINDLCIDEDIRDKWNFFLAQLNLNAIDDVVRFTFLSKLIFQIRKEIFKTAAQKKLNATVEKITKEESIQIDSASEEGKSVIRHLGGWAVFTVINELTSYITKNLTSESSTVFNRVNKYVNLRRILLDYLTVSAFDIHKSTSFTASLQHTDYYSRGNLTYITDSCYLFFLELERKVENFLQLSFFIQTGKQFVHKATIELLSDEELKSLFFKLLPDATPVQENSVNPSSTGMNQVEDNMDSLEEIDFDSSEFEVIEICDSADQSDQGKFNDTDNAPCSCDIEPNATTENNFSPCISDPKEISTSPNSPLSSHLIGSDTDRHVEPPHSPTHLANESLEPSHSPLHIVESSESTPVDELCNHIINSFPSSNLQLQETDNIATTAFKKIIFKFLCVDARIF